MIWIRIVITYITVFVVRFIEDIFPLSWLTNTLCNVKLFASYSIDRYDVVFFVCKNY
jgi:hypothetical protein